MAQEQRQKLYRVVVAPPKSPPATYENIVAASKMDAKVEASKIYYGRLFTGQFKWMRASLM